MPTLQEYREELDYAYNNRVNNYCGIMGSKGNSLKIFFETGNGSAQMRTYWTDFYSAVIQGFYWMIGRSYLNHEEALLNWMTLGEQQFGGSVDMDSILNAMLAAKFDELQKFIGLVDAYRVALWNAPFNADFYAALARGFAQWQ